MKQDNRIPKVIEDFTPKAQATDMLSFLSFDDWLGAKETESQDWIIVARSSKIKPSDFWTFSALATPPDGNLTKLLEQPTWDVDMKFGHPFFYGVGGEKVAHYDPGTSDVKKGVEFKPFVIYREFQDYIPNHFELSQSFMLYHNLFFVPESQEFRSIDHNGDIQCVVRIEQDQHDNKLIAISCHHLKDFLAANQSYLIRYHDHRRFSEADISGAIGGQFKKQIFSSPSSCFELWLRTDIPFDAYRSLSRLVGKDVVPPYQEPDKNRTLFATGKRKGEFISFLISLDEQGNEVESTCDEDELSNYFTDRGTPHFLTPVFFEQRVLAKYYAEPSRYTVGNSGVGCLSIWSIPIDITDEELVQVWLGDLGNIPHKEQLHWRQFNVPPRGTITRHRFLRDFMAEFADPPDDPLHLFWASFEEVQSEVNSRYAEEFLLRLGKEDNHIYQTFHLPLTEEWKEFDEQIQFLAKITIDSINVDLISRVSGKKIDGKEIKGSIALLHTYLSQLEPNEEICSQVVLPFQAIQSLRSTGSAHRKGEKFQQALLRLQIDNLSNREKVKRLLSDTARSLASIAEIIRNKKATPEGNSPDCKSVRS